MNLVPDSVRKTSQGGHSAGARLRVGNELRAFASVDQSNEVLGVHEAVCRENFY